MALFGFRHGRSMVSRRKIAAVYAVLPPTSDVALIQRMTNASGYLGLPADRAVRDLVERAATNSRLAVEEFAKVIQAATGENGLGLEEMNRRLADAQPVNSTRWLDREDIWAELTSLENTGLNGPLAQVIRETLVDECLPQLTEKLGGARSALFALSDATPSALSPLKSKANVAAVSARHGKEALTSLRRRWS